MHLVHLLVVSLALIGFVPVSIFAEDTPPSATPAESRPSPSYLYLRHGDFLRGEFVECDDPLAVRWKSPHFQTPVEYPLAQVQDVRWGEPPSPAAPKAPVPADPAGPNVLGGVLRLLNQLPRVPQAPAANSTPAVPVGTRFDLQNGSVLFGSLQAFDEQRIRIDCPRHGIVDLPRQHFTAIDRLNADGTLVLDSSGQLQTWTSLGSEPRSLDEWRVERGLLETQRPGANLFRSIPAEGPWLIELQIEGNEQPEFQLAFGCTATITSIPRAINVIYKDNELIVFRQLGQEQDLVRLPLPSNVENEDAKWRLNLQFFVAGATGQVMIFSQGQSLGQFGDGIPLELPGRGIFVRNRGKNLRLGTMRVRRWSGQPPRYVNQPELDHAYLTNGDIVSGKLLRFDESLAQVTWQIDGMERTLERTQIDRLVLASVSPTTRDASLTQADYRDGTQIRGHYAGTNSTGMLLRTFPDTQPILATWADMLQIDFGASTNEPPTTLPHGLVEGPGIHAHGDLVNNIETQEIQWLPAGARAAVAFTAKERATTTFGARPQGQMSVTTFDEITLTNGDTIPCRFSQLAQDQVAIQFADGTQATIPEERVRAIRLRHTGGDIYSGFLAKDRWLTMRKAGTDWSWHDGRIDIHNPCMLARRQPIVPRCQLEFDVRLAANATFVVGFGADTPENALQRYDNVGFTQEMMEKLAKERPDFVVEVRLTRSENTLQAQGLVKAAGMMGNFIAFNGGFNNMEAAPRSLPISEDGTAHIQIMVDQTRREYFVVANGQELHSWRDTSNLEGDYLYLGAAGVNPSVMDENGNPVAAASHAQGGPLVSIENFRVARWPGQMDDADRQRFLTRRLGTSATAMTHAVRSYNGDSLRGKVTSIDDTIVGVESRLESFRLPRAKIAEIIRFTTASPVSSQSNDSGTNVESESTETVPTSPSDQTSEATLHLLQGQFVHLSQLKTSKDYLKGISPIAGPVAIPWSWVRRIDWGQSGVRRSPYEEWQMRDPPPLPEPSESSDADANLLVGKPAPDVTFSMLDGSRTTLTSLKGRIVVLDFWASWCGPCVVATPTLIEVTSSFGEEVKFIGVNQQEPAETVQEFLSSHGWNLLVALDQDGQIGKLFGASAIPLSVIIDQQGVVRHVHVGATPQLGEEIAREIRVLLSPPPADSNSATPLP